MTEIITILTNLGREDLVKELNDALDLISTQAYERGYERGYNIGYDAAEAEFNE